MDKFTYGIKDLDERFSSALRPGTTILIAGYPGAGKTTASASLCYKNALLGHPCIYLSFNEHKDKFLLQMKSFGMNFKELENKGLFRYIKLPIVPKKESISEFINMVSDLVMKYKPKVLAIDGITPMIEVLKEPGTARSFLQTVLYDIPRIMNGIVVLVADLPFGEQHIGLGGIEFVADIVFIMRYFVASSRIIRMLEIRKLRGAPINVAEIPYRLTEGEGIKVFLPILPESVKPPMTKKSYYFGLKTLDNAIAPIYPGHSILIIYPPHARSVVLSVAPIIKLMINNDLRGVIFSCRYSNLELKQYVKGLFNMLGLSGDLVEKYFLGFYGFNPSAMSFQELFFRMDSIIDEHKPDIVITHGYEIIHKLVELSGSGLDRLFLLMYNRMLMMRSKGIIVFRLISNISDDLFKALSLLSEIVIKIDYDVEGSMVKPRYLVWRTGREPVLVDPVEIYREFIR